MGAARSERTFGEGGSVPTIVQFVGGESLTLDDDFDRVNQQLGDHDAGLFNRLVGDDPVRVTIYRSNVAYIQEHTGESPWVATGHTP
jgi:hypothetical protein